MVPLYFAFSRLFKSFFLFFRPDISQCATHRRQDASYQEQTAQPVNSANSVLVEKTSKVQTEDNSLLPNKRLNEKLTTGQVISARDIMTDSELLRINTNYKKGAITKFVKEQNPPQNNFGLIAEKIANQKHTLVTSATYYNLFRPKAKILFAINNNDITEIRDDITRIEKLVLSRIGGVSSSKVLPKTGTRIINTKRLPIEMHANTPVDIVNQTESSKDASCDNEKTNYADQAESSKAEYCDKAKTSYANQAESSNATVTRAGDNVGNLPTAVTNMSSTKASSTAMREEVFDRNMEEDALNADFKETAQTAQKNRHQIDDVIRQQHEHNIENGIVVDSRRTEDDRAEISSSFVPVSLAEPRSDEYQTDAAQTSYADQAESSKAASYANAQTSYTDQAKSSKAASRRDNVKISYTEQDLAEYIEEVLDPIRQKEHFSMLAQTKTQKACNKQVQEHINKAIAQTFSFQEKEIPKIDLTKYEYDRDSLVIHPITGKKFKVQKEVFNICANRYIEEFREHYEQFLKDQQAAIDNHQIDNHKKELERAHAKSSKMPRSVQDFTEEEILAAAQKAGYNCGNRPINATKRPAAPLLLTELSKDKSQTSTAQTKDVDQAEPNNISARTLKCNHHKADKDKSQLTNQDNQVYSAKQENQDNKANKANKANQNNKTNKNTSVQGASRHSMHMTQDVSPTLKNRGGFCESNSYGYNAFYLVALGAFLLFLNAFFYRPKSNMTQKRWKTTKI